MLYIIKHCRARIGNWAHLIALGVVALKIDAEGLDPMGLDPLDTKSA